MNMQWLATCFATSIACTFAASAKNMTVASVVAEAGIVNGTITVENGGRLHFSGVVTAMVVAGGAVNISGTVGTLTVETGLARISGRVGEVRGTGRVIVESGAMIGGNPVPPCDTRADDLPLCLAVR